MDAEFQVCWQAKVTYRIFNNAEIRFKLLVELGHITYIINTFIKTAGKFRGDGLRRYLFICHSRKNKEHFYRRLGIGRFIHGHFCYESTIIFVCQYVAINLACFLNSVKIFFCNGLQQFCTDFERLGKTGNRKLTNKPAVLL